MTLLRRMKTSTRVLIGVAAVPILASALYAATGSSRGAQDSVPGDARFELAQAGGSRPEERPGAAPKKAAPVKKPAAGAGAQPEPVPQAPPVVADATVPSGRASFVPTALQHATTARVSRCAPLIGQATQFTASAPSATLSQWSQERPDDHMFQALIGMGTSPAQPSSAAVVIASPMGGGCEVSVVQVRPSPRACSEIQAEAQRNGATTTDLSGMVVLTGNGTARELLVPAAGAGCVLVGTGLALNR